MPMNQQEFNERLLVILKNLARNAESSTAGNAANRLAADAEQAGLLPIGAADRVKKAS